MRTRLSLVLILLCVAAGASAQRVCKPHLGILDQDHSVAFCCHDIVLDDPFTINIDLTDLSIFEPGIAEVRFQLLGLPENLGAPDGEWSITWHQPGTTVSEDFSVTIIFDPPLTNPPDFMPIATIDFTAYSDTWIGDDHALVFAGLDIRGAYSQQFETYAGQFTFNPTASGECDCFTYFCGYLNWVLVSDVVPPAGESVSDEFQIEFLASSLDCMTMTEERPYTGSVHVNGELLGGFSGTGVGTHQFTLSTAGLVVGDEMVVEIYIDNEGYWKRSTVVYVVDEHVPTEASSFSQIKSRY